MVGVCLGLIIRWIQFVDVQRDVSAREEDDPDLVGAEEAFHIVQKLLPFQTTKFRVSHAPAAARCVVRRDTGFVLPTATETTENPT